MKQFLRYTLTLVAILIATTNAWAQSPNFQNNTWYSLYDTKQENNVVSGSTFAEKAVFSPAESMTFDYKKYSILSSNGKIEVQNKVDGTNWSSAKGSVSHSSTSWKTSSTIELDANISHIRYKLVSSSGGSIKNSFVKLKKHILLNNGTTFGTNSLNVTDNNLATSVGVRSTNAYAIPLRSFFTKSGTITITSTNSEFHFSDGKVEKTITLPTNNFCVSSSASGSPGNNWKGISDFLTTYNTQIYFTPSVNINGTRSTIITISDGTNSATITLTAPVKPTYFFKAAAIPCVMDEDGTINQSTAGGTATAIFNNNGGGSTCEVITNNGVTSANAIATFAATPNTAAGYVFDGWAENIDSDPFNTNQTITKEITSSALSEPESQQTYYAIFVKKYNPIIEGTESYSISVDENLPADFQWDKVDAPADNNYPSSDENDSFYFKIKHTLPVNAITTGSAHPDKVIAYDPKTNTITALNAGTAELTIKQKGNNRYNEKTFTCTITVNKHQTEFYLDLNSEYLVDEIDNNLFSTTTDLTGRTVNVSDSKNYFTYSNGELIANCPTELPRDQDQTTITVTQPENYKWTSYTQEKNVTVKKRQTNFAWNDGESLECYVDDKTDITNLYTKASDNTLPVNFNIEVIERGYGNTDVVTLENGVLEAIGEGKVVVTASQAVDHKWTDFSTPITINVKRYDVSAKLNPTTTVWNATHSNPFSVSISPANGETITDFFVGESSNSTIATYNASSKTIQTYYTSGSANFQITRREDRKYNALDQTLTLTVNANWGCNLLDSDEETSIDNSIFSSDTYSKVISFEGIGDTLKFQYRVRENANAQHNVTPQYSTEMSGDNFTDFNTTYSTNSTTWSQTVSVPLNNENIKRIRFKRTSSRGTKTVELRNINITRAQYIRPTDGERALSSTDTLKLPTVAIDQPSSQPFNLKWSACSDIKIVWNNPKFTISTTDITARDGSLDITVSCNTSEIGTFTDNVIIYNQEQMKTFPISCKVYTKWITDSISGSTTHSMKVDESWGTDFYFPVQRASQYPTTGGAFHYAIERTFVDADPADRNPNNPDEVISYNNGVITAHNAGTAILTIKHEETDEHFASEQFTCTLTVSKHDAKRQWKYPVYYNDTISNYFTTTDTISPIVIVSQTDTAVAKLTNEFNPTSNNSLDLITFNKEASTTVTVSQAENYKWNGYSKDTIITPIDPSNHVTFTIDSEARMWVFQPTSNEQLSWSNGIKVTKGDLIDANWDDRYVIINFTGIPKDMSFSFEPSVDGTTYEYWYVDESPNGQDGTWTRAWNTEGEGDNYERGTVTEHPLLPTTRYLKLCYSGNYGGIFKNLHVTELNEFRAVDSQKKTLDKDTLDFGANQVYTNKTRTFDLRYANPGYKITVESTDPHFTVTPDFIGNIGGEHHGTLPITVSYTSEEKYAVNGEAMIIIKDEIGHADTVRLYASSDKAQQVLHWRSDFEDIFKPIIRRKNGKITDAAWATSQLKPVTFTSNNENVIKISDDGTTLILVAVGEAEITANQEGNEMWLPATPITKTFIVTDKLLQYIIWEDDLTNIIKEDIDPQTLPLTAKVYLQQENDTAVFSQEQTDRLRYESDNNDIVSAAGTTLTVHNIGKTTLTVSVDGDEDYAPASMTKTVIVRSPALGCEDNLLYHHTGDPIQFFQYNLDEIIKEPIALDRNQGIPGYVIVAHYGESWNLGIQYYAADIRVEQSLDNGSTWSTVETIKPVKNQENIDSIPLSRQATHIRFVRNAGGQGYQFLYNIDVHPAQYIEARDIKSPHEEITVVPFGEIHVGSSETRTFLLDYSNIKHTLSPVPSTSEITATPNSFGECSGFGRQEISVTWLPTAINDNATETITFTDPNSGMKKVVTLTAKIIKGTQLVVWDDRPDTIEDCGTITFPEYTTAHLPITWTVVEGNEYADFNKQGMLEIYKNGRIVVQATTQEDNANYKPLDPVFFTFDIQLNITFVGTEGTDWNNPNNWAMCRLPLTEEVVTIAAPAELSTHDTIKGIIFDSITPDSIHITHTGGLTINEAGVTNAAADGSSIIIDNNPQGAGFLLISPSAPEANKHPYFTMNFTTRAFNEGVPRDETWQYMGAPGNQATIKDLDKTLIYHWDETKGWTPYTITDTIPTWQGYALTQSIETNHTYHITAQAIQDTMTINLTYTASGMKGDNLFVNSFTAPIDITKIDSTTDVTGDWKYKTFYFFNTGSWNDWQGTNPNHSHDDASSAGHYYAVPLFSAQYLEGSQTIVPPMQGVYVHTDNADVSITLDYTKHVWNGAAGNLPMRAPQKQSPDFQRVRIQVSSENSGADRMYIIQVPSTTRDYDNGYDGKNINAKGQVNIYTNEPFGKMEVSCANNIDSMYIGLRTGNDSLYTLTFGAIAGDSLFLQDLQNDSIIPLFDDEQYHFTAEPNTINNNRFLLLSHPYKAPNGETSTPETDGDEITKIWSIGKVIYIANAPANSVASLYTVGGHLVLSTPIANTQSPTILDVSYLPEGVYILRLNNQVYKFVCK